MRKKIKIVRHFFQTINIFQKIKYDEFGQT